MAGQIGNELGIAVVRKLGNYVAIKPTKNPEFFSVQFEVGTQVYPWVCFNLGAVSLESAKATILGKSFKASEYMSLKGKLSTMIESSDRHLRTFTKRF